MRVQRETGGNIAYYDRLAREYDLFFHDLNCNMEEEGDWLAGVLRRRRTARILDASCGTGRQAVPLVQRGFDVVAADPSRAMLDEAEALARKRGLCLPLLQVAFTELPRHMGAEFDAVIALGNGLCNLECPDDILSSLRGMRACCRPGGCCLIGVKDFDRIKVERPRFHGHGVVDRDGVRTILFEIWDYADPMLIVTAFLTVGAAGSGGGGECWKTSTAQTREYMVGSEELGSLARQAGFTTVERLDHPAEAVYLLTGCGG